MIGRPRLLIKGVGIGQAPFSARGNTLVDGGNKLGALRESFYGGFAAARSFDDIFPGKVTVATRYL